MNEKKLTDEEIVKALECCNKTYNDMNRHSCDTCPYKEIEPCGKAQMIDCLNLIHRLKGENASLKAKYVKMLDLNEKTIAKQKAEIEQLTKENKNLSIKVWNYEQPARTPLYSSESMVHCNLVTCYDENYDLKAKNAELQKQIDELKVENTELHKERTTLIAGSILKQQDIAKDTAKEICKFILKYWQGHDLVECDWLRVAIAEKYGVEVE